MTEWVEQRAAVEQCQLERGTRRWLIRLQSFLTARRA